MIRIKNLRKWQPHIKGLPTGINVYELRKLADGHRTCWLGTKNKIPEGYQVIRVIKRGARDAES